MSAADKRHALRQLHASGCFVIPNPWDLGSARLLESLGFKALATTSTPITRSAPSCVNKSAGRLLRMPPSTSAMPFL